MLLIKCISFQNRLFYNNLLSQYFFLYFSCDKFFSIKQELINQGIKRSNHKQSEILQCGIKTVCFKYIFIHKLKRKKYQKIHITLRIHYHERIRAAYQKMPASTCLSAEVRRINAGDIYPTVKCHKDSGSKGESALGQQILRVDLEDVSMNGAGNSWAWSMAPSRSKEMNTDSKRSLNDPFVIPWKRCLTLFQYKCITNQES